MKKILIVGGGPAGSSAAIRLCSMGYDVTLIEREIFPRNKLCGEFLSPECVSHFRELGILDEVLSSGANRVSRTTFYDERGNKFTIKSDWFSGKDQALSVSRATLDSILLNKAKGHGVSVLQGWRAIAILKQKERICGVRLKNEKGMELELQADLIIDATGKSASLVRMASTEKLYVKNKLIGFKAHFDGVESDPEACEMYVFPGGYGGVTKIELGLTNHCFLITAEVAKQFDGNPEKIMKNVIFCNRRAYEVFRKSRVEGRWYSVSLDGFGFKKDISVKGIVAIGDASVFIDPFTGSGILLALQSSKLLSLSLASREFSEERYKRECKRALRARMLFCTMLRRFAFASKLSSEMIRVLALSENMSRLFAIATRF
jgi:flavin-dependent dehydrogenase